MSFDDNDDEFGGVMWGPNEEEWAEFEASILAQNTMLESYIEEFGEDSYQYANLLEYYSGKKDDDDNEVDE